MKILHMICFLEPQFNPDKHKVGEKTCRFVQFPDEEKALFQKDLYFNLSKKYVCKKKRN